MRSSTRTISHLVSASLPLYLVCQPVSDSAPTVTASAPVDTIAIVDVSGSMSWDLPTFKRDLKNLLPRVLKSGDTFSLIYFSGAGQSAVLLDRAEIRGGGQALLDVTAIHATIDRLDTIGLTCFDEPLALVAQIPVPSPHMGRDRRRHVIFGSDGYDNASKGGSQAERRRNILAAVTKLSGTVDRVTTMGVGYSCDQGLLQEMAATAGGSFMFASDITRYSRDFEAAVGQRPSGARRHEVRFDGVPIDGIAWTISDEGEIAQYNAESGAVHVATDAGSIWYLSNGAVGTAGASLRDALPGERGRAEDMGQPAPSRAAYAALVLFAQRARRKVVRALATGLSDARFVRAALGAFGPQRYNALADAALEAVKSIDARWSEGFADPFMLNPDPHAYTVLDAIGAMAKGKNRIMVEHEAFSYTPITRGRISSAGILTASEVEQIAELTKGLTAGCEIGMLDGFLAALAAIKTSKAPIASYAYVPTPDGYPIDGIVPSSKEANVSIRVKRAIDVDLSAALASLPEPIRGKLPTTFRTHRYSTYAVITGRVLNLARVPMILDVTTWAEFARAGIIDGGEWTPDRIYVVDLAALPMMNDTMLEGLSARETVRAAYDLEVVKAARKVFEDVRRDYIPKEQSAVAEWVASTGVRGDGEASVVLDWLDRIGISDGGFSPPSTGATLKSDPRKSWRLDVKIPGLSSLPTVEKVREKMTKIETWKAAPKGKEPKFTAAERLMSHAIGVLDEYVTGEGLDLAKMDERQVWKLASFLDQVLAPLDARRADLLFALSRVAIVAICGGEWFADLAPGADTVTLDVGDEKPIVCNIGIADVEIAL